VFFGKKILIVEDEPLIAFDLEAAIRDRQGDIVGPAHTLADAVRIAEVADIDGAILDVRLKDGGIEAVLACLLRRDIACVIHTGEADAAIAGAWPDIPVVGKPALPEVVLAALTTAMGRGPQSRPRRDDSGGSFGGCTSGG
jgi:DNA-binding NarL/FixJ family response regulator